MSRVLVEIRRGKGTFVAAPRITQDLKELSGFVEDMHALGRKPTARVIGKEIVSANATVARQLALARGERVVRIRRVRLADGVPLSFDETYLPLEIGKKIITNNLKVEPIFSLLERSRDRSHREQPAGAPGRRKLDRRIDWALSHPARGGMFA